MDCRIRLQLAEALGDDNRWYCSQANGREIKDANLLVAHYIHNGGATDFARRFDEAMSRLNRYYCCEFHRRDVRDPESLWNYYMNHTPVDVNNHDELRRTPAVARLAG